MADPRRMTPNGPQPAEPDGDEGSLPGAGEEPRAWDPFEEGAHAPGSEAGLDGHDRQCLDWCPICRSADIVRATATPEMREQWLGIQRDALLALRALLDGYIDRFEQERGREGSGVEDIPIE